MTFLKFAAATAIALACLGAQAQEATIRKNLAERIPQMPKIDEVSKSPMAGLYELRVNGSDIMYTDAEGNFLIQGNLIDTKLRRNLTEERVEKLSAVDFDALPSKDAFTIVRGNGKRKIAVFEDPNCGYCKRFEKDMQKIDNVTISLYLYPILSADSTDKSRNIWCSKDKAKAWTDWMLRNQTPTQAAANCDAPALARNVEFGKKYRITGTPTLIFADGSRIPGAIPSEQVEEHLAKLKN
ncbi:thiol:disulfide interchange protein DsbC [Rhodoferax sp. OV413]|uniref:DsbC family protein n=1 Tax=Rhodoferax sp. OV413 TaxID=1855285 RepID=UPI00088A4550|nr:DsbC family protein [Rhodoferax sp. OV413]SDP57981.1 thiol:disulfide interchange protein DsbC [Rhodoferax sp. OV413]